ncbi:unnamed protein product [Urochloa humidicola]
MSSSTSQTFPWQTKQEATSEEAEETNPELYEHFANLISSLPSSAVTPSYQLYRHEQGWHASMAPMVGAMVADSCFAARPSDIIVTTLPKYGTTWIKSLLYAIVHRGEYPVDADDHPFHSMSRHECINFFEYHLYSENRIPNLDKLTDPRLFATLVPFVSLPRTIMTTSCKIVYVCRDPKDTLISTWYFLNKFRAKAGMDPLTVERATELFCDGLWPFGPYWDHVLGYWHAHLAHPEKVLFFRYEEMQRDPEAHVRRLAEFVDLPFGAGEEKDGVVAAIVRLCSFENMSGLKATKDGSMVVRALIVAKDGHIENNLFYRCGVVGDWASLLSPEAARRIDAITLAKFKGSGLNV